MNTNPHEAKIQLLEEELQQMRQTVRQLQADRDTDLKHIDELESQLSLCLKYVTSASAPTYTTEDLEKWAREMEEWAHNPPADALPLSAFIDELEALAHGAAQGEK